MKRLAYLGTATLAIALFVLGASGEATAQGADDPGQVEAGQVVFEANCARCHGADGTGTNRGRPLTGIAMQGERAQHVQSVTEGRGGMPSFESSLSEAEIDQAVSYVRLTFVAAEEPAAEEPAAEEPAAEEPAAEEPAAAADEPAATTELALTGVNSSVLASCL